MVRRPPSAACPDGECLAAIAADGTITCRPDTGTEYMAGSGLTLTGTTFSVDPTAVQAPLSGACPAGEYLAGVTADGTITCRPDVDTDTTYAAGTGLTLTGTTCRAP